MPDIHARLSQVQDPAPASLVMAGADLSHLILEWQCRVGPSDEMQNWEDLPGGGGVVKESLLMLQLSVGKKLQISQSGWSLQQKPLASAGEHNCARLRRERDAWRCSLTTADLTVYWGRVSSRRLLYSCAAPQKRIWHLRLTVSHSYCVEEEILWFHNWAVKPGGVNPL